MGIHIKEPKCHVPHFWAATWCCTHQMLFIYKYPLLNLMKLVVPAVSPLPPEVSSSSHHHISSPEWSLQSPVVSPVSTDIQQSTSRNSKSLVVTAVSRSLPCLYRQSTSLYSKSQVVPVVSCSLPCFHRSLAVNLIVFQVPGGPCSLLQSPLSLQVARDLQRQGRLQGQLEIQEGGLLETCRDKGLYRRLQGPLGTWNTVRWTSRDIQRHRRLQYTAWTT